MKNTVYSFIVIGLLILAGCGVQVRPVVTADVTLDPKEELLVSTKENTRVSVRIAPQSYSFYGMEDTFMIFYVKVENLGQKEATISPDDFMILDDMNHQVNVMKPEDVAKIVEQNLFYLIPYPYVGYYSESLNYYEGRYLYNPSAPHTYSVSPREIYSEAFPFGRIYPNAHLKGKIYFRKKVSEAKRIDLLAFREGASFKFKFSFDIK